MSTNSMPARTTLRLALISRQGVEAAHPATAPRPRSVSVVVKGCDATEASAPVRALNNGDLPALGKPTRPSRSIARDAIGWPTARFQASASTCSPGHWPPGPR